MTADRLRIENMKEPIGIDVIRPRISWTCDGGIRQTAYRITAYKGDDPGNLIWDTGKICSADMTLIPYEGHPLESRDIVTLHVTLWDENDVQGESAGTSFEMGLLDGSDWKATWIAGGNKSQGHGLPADCFRKVFKCPEGIKRARLYATARGVYDACINGCRIEDFILAPGMTDYRKRIQYQTYDVTDLIRAGGTNEIVMRLGDGWYRGSVAAYGITEVYGSETALMAQLELTMNDGSIRTIATDGSWQWSDDGQIRFADLKDGEVYDAQRTPSYLGRARVTEKPEKGKNANPPVICSSNNVYVTEHERLNPVLLTAFDGTRVLDFGQNIAGYPEFTITGERGQVVKFVLGETTSSGGRVDLSGIQEEIPAAGWNQARLLRKLMFGQAGRNTTVTPKQEITFICSGGEDHYKTSFSVFGFRYMEVQGDIEIDPGRFTAIAVYSDIEETGDYRCSDDRVNRLVSNTRWSMKGNFLDVPTDCPTRERLGWTGDAQIFFNTGAYFMNTAPFFSKWLRDMEDAQYKDGLLPAVLPFSGAEMMYKSSGTSAGWADAVYLIPYRYYLRYGDEDILRRYWPMMDRYFGHLISTTGLSDRKKARHNPYNKDTYDHGVQLGEWLEPLEFRDKGAREKHPEEATAYYYLAMKTGAEIAGILGLDERSEELARHAEGAACAYRCLFTDNSMLDTDRQSKLVRPLAMGLLNEEKKTRAEKRLAEAIRNFDLCVGTGFLSTAFLLPVLSGAGMTDLAYRMLLNPASPGWLSEAERGATTIWESWEGDLSLNHYSPGSVCEWLFAHSAGIRTDGPRKFVIAPEPDMNDGVASISWAEAEYDSPYGRVSNRWVRDDANGGHITYEVSIPANCEAMIILPDGTRENAGAGVHRYETN